MLTTITDIPVSSYRLARMEYDSTENGNMGGRDFASDIEPSRQACSPTVLAVELAPGVAVTQALRGLINLGVPLGTEEYVREEALSIVQSHDSRLRAIVRLANHEGAEVLQDKVNVARQASPA